MEGHCREDAMRVVFLGNHTVGVTALSALLDVADVTGVIAHPTDPEDGVRYASVYDFAVARGLPVIRARGRDAVVPAFLAQAAADLLWITDYRYLLPSELLTSAPYGAVNLHPSLLPRYRGRAPLNWAILHGEREVGLTAHVVDAGMDSGDILTQHRLVLDDDEDVGHALERLMPLYDALPREIVRGLETQSLRRVPQDHALATTFPARTPADGRVQWAAPARHIHNLVRAVAAPYPGAFTRLDDRRVTIWRTRPVECEDAAPPGTILSVQDGVPTVQCGHGALALVQTDADDIPWVCGAQLS
jgi:methionyl-tRNA formyltransferase